MSRGDLHTREGVEARMLSGEPFTYGDLSDERGTARDSDRLLDRTIQRLRKRGLIAWRREEGRVVWRALKAADGAPSETGEARE